MIWVKELPARCRQRLLNSWNRADGLTLLLLPLSFVYWLIFHLKKSAYNLGIAEVYQSPVPVIVVGNITVGGTGKTPMVVHLVELLRKLGYTPGVISRGYSGKSPSYPVVVDSDTSVTICGDEPAMIVDRTNVAMVIGPNRREDIELLIKEFNIDVVVSDDGLQHFAMARDIEICLHDSTGEQTNFNLLPAGPYREPLSALEHFDMVVNHVAHNDLPASEFQMNLVPLAVEPVGRSQSSVFDSSSGVHAVAGIGNPHRFFETCRNLDWDIIEHSFKDHHAFKSSDLKFGDGLPIVMTQKDAIKCREFNNNNLWYLPVDVKIGNEFSQRIKALLDQLTS